MTDADNAKAAKLIADYRSQPCGLHHNIRLDELTMNMSKFSKDVMKEDCVIDRDGTTIVQGGVIPIIVDFAGVYLARMYSKSEFITKLARLEEDYLKPVVLGQDKEIVVRAWIDSIVGRKILVNVLVENENREIKGKATLLFLERKE